MKQCKLVDLFGPIVSKCKAWVTVSGKLDQKDLY